MYPLDSRLFARILFIHGLTERSLAFVQTIKVRLTPSIKHWIWCVTSPVGLGTAGRTRLRIGLDEFALRSCSLELIPSDCQIDYLPVPHHTNRATMAPSVFFITGCSSGFGAELVKQCISEGDKCIATSRNSSKLNFSGTSEDNFLAVDCDVTKQESVHSCASLSLYVMLISQPQIN